MKNSPEFQLAQLNIGTAEHAGKRPLMEDRSIVVNPFMGDPRKVFIGLFDGHGGAGGAEIAARNLSSYFHRAYYDEFYQKQGKTIPQMLNEAFVLTDQEIERTEKSGTTAVVAYKDGDNLTIANAGDSRAVLVTRDGYRRITEDNKATNKSGVFRVNKAGGVLARNYLMMPNGDGLAVSRALGDRAFSGVVIPNPNVYQHKITKGDIGLILACDGIWDVVSDALAAQIIKAVGSPGIASRALVNEAYGRGSGDNLSAIVLNLSDSKR